MHVHDDWTPWAVAPSSGFRVDDPSGQVGLIQVDATQFLVSTPFAFTDGDVEARLLTLLIENGETPETAQARVDAALIHQSSPDEMTDLASVPPFMRWFENSYGSHTLAAIIHDQLIVDEPNGGALGSDIAADLVFREMMRSAGVGWLRRWIMWTAVALRTRWVAGGRRQASVALWGVLSLVGITGFIWGVVRTVGGDGGIGLMLGAIALGLAASVLWGRQIGAGLIAMATGFFLIPAALVAGLGLAAFTVTDRVFRGLGFR
ncbi:MAG: DUF1353 domain-containing protein [Actinomycetota bacterium]